MSQNLCPACSAPLEPADLNMAEGVGLCRGCGKLSRLSDIALAAEETAESADIAETPSGCSVSDSGVVGEGGRIVVRASLRSIAGAIGLGIFALFWNGIVSVFVAVAVGGWWTKLIGPAPAWFPMPTVRQGRHGPSQTGAAMGTGELIFLTLFITPFVLIGLGVLFACLTSMFGSVRVSIEGDAGRVRTGIGPLSFGKRFDALNVKSVAIGASTMKQNGRTQPQIVLNAEKEVRFGAGLPKDRRAWMVAALRKLLVESRATARR